MGFRIHLPKEIDELHAVSKRAAMRAREAFDKWEKETADLKSGEAKRKHTAPEIFHPGLEARTRAVAARTSV
jgi:hypothetical protein